MATTLLALDGYAVEGGLDGRGRPATCYASTIALGRHEGPGEAAGLWARYEEVLDAAAELGLAGVALSVEWARVEPLPGEVDESALARYRAVIEHARARGLRVTVRLITAAWPSWLGPEAWILPWVVPHALAHAARVAEALGEGPTGWVVFADPAGLVAGGYLEGTRPPWRRRARAEAALARRQLARITAAVAATAHLGAGLVEARSVELDPIALARSRWARGEVHVRSLVRGKGPTASARGLLAFDGRAWVVEDESVLALLR